MKKYLLLGLLLLLTACSSGGSYTPDQNYFEGYDSLNVEFIDQAPPREVYEGTEFDLQLLISNEGAFSLIDNYSAELGISYDSAIIEDITNQQPPGEYIDRNVIHLNGKSYYFPEGESNYFPVARFAAQPIPGNFETTDTTINLNFCYPYKTYFSGMVCIDTDPEGTDLRKKICKSEDVSVSGGQGAPLAITAVEVQTIPKGAYIQPLFIIHIENMGDGGVSDFLLEDHGTGHYGCGPINVSTANYFQIEGYLSGEKLICKPDNPVIRFGEAIVECQLESNSILSTTNNYLTSLDLELSYLYSTGEEKDIVVKRLKGATFDKPSTEIIAEDCAPWQTYLAQNKTCVDTCMYCKDKGASCYSNTKFENNESTEVLNNVVDWKYMNCLYAGAEDCRKNQASCLLENNLCAPGTYCGWPTCINNNKKPQIKVESKTQEQAISWSCVDSDDKKDLVRTCGCDSEFEYKLVKKSEADSNDDCALITGYTPVKAKYSSLYKRYLFKLKLPGPYGDDDSLCIGVKDKLGERAFVWKDLPY